MLVNMQTKKLNLNKCSINENVSAWIEQDIIVPDTKPDAMKIIHVTVTPYVNDFEVMNGKIKVIGKLNYFIIYRVDDETFNTRGLFMSYPFTEVLNVEKINSSMNLTVVPKCKNVIFSLPNERKIAVKSEILFNINVKDSVEINLIKGFEDEDKIECKMCEKNFCNVIQNKSSIIASKEDIMLPKEAEDFYEILDIDTCIKNTEYKESYNKIMVKGDIEVKLLYLAQNQEEKVKCTVLEVPFSAMIELENINDRSKFDIKYIMQDFDIRMNEDITTTKTMSADYQIDVEVSMYEEENVEYVDDFYSQNKELEYDVDTVEAISKDVSFVKTIDIKENISNILPQNNKIVDYRLDTNYITPKINNNSIELDGNAKISLLLQDLETGELNHKTVDVLINEKYEMDNVDNNSKVTVDIIGESLNIVQNGMDIEVRLILDVNTNVEDVVNLNIIDKIEDAVLDLSNIDSINIYIVKPGDTLWKIAKKYKTSVEKIVKINDIADPDKIDVGQKILIIR